MTADTMEHDMMADTDGMDFWRSYLALLRKLAPDREEVVDVCRALGVSVAGFDGDVDLVWQAQQHMADIAGADAADRDAKQAVDAIEAMRTRHVQELEAVRRGQAIEAARATAVLADALKRQDAARWAVTRLQTLVRKRPQMFSRDGMAFIDVQQEAGKQ